MNSFILTFAFPTLFCIQNTVNGIQTYRSDVVAEIRSAEGHVDVEDAPWYNGTFCDDGEYAIGFNFKSENDTSDNTGGNGVRLSCATLDNTSLITEIIETDSEKEFGVWVGFENCSQTTNGTFLVGFKTSVQSDQGIGDDATLTCLFMQCTNNDYNETLSPDSCLDEADIFGNWSYCPDNSYICGLTERYESDQGLSDDTALNAVRFFCCDGTATTNPPTTTEPTTTMGLTSLVIHTYIYVNIFVCNICTLMFLFVEFGAAQQYDCFFLFFSLFWEGFEFILFCLVAVHNRATSNVYRLLCPDNNLCFCNLAKNSMTFEAEKTKRSNRQQKF